MTRRLFLRHTEAPRHRGQNADRFLGASVPLCVVTVLAFLVPVTGAQQAPPAPAPSARAAAPVDLTGYWVSVVTEDWAWRMRTPPKGDYASVPLTAEGRRVADTWTEAQDGSCLAFGAAALLRVPGRLHISWEGDSTLKIETDAGQQTRLLRFGPAGPQPSQRTLQGSSAAEWQTVAAGRGARGGGPAPPTWASLKVVTTNLRAAWLRPNGVPHSENAALTEYFDRFDDGPDQWFTVTTLVEDPVYLAQPFTISSNFRREPDGAKWRVRPCRAS